MADCDGGAATIDDLGLRPDQSWCSKLERQWRIGESAAHQVLDEFIDQTLQRYKSKRDYPAIAATSRLSPYLHFGEISPQTVWQRLTETGVDENGAAFKRQLVWREFSYSLLYHNPRLPEQNLKTKFDRFPWAHSQRRLQHWQQGRTGYPFVDAGMRELWQTGFMHNRVRLVVGSFLVKNLLIHWHHGAEWFWDTLLEADLANNSANWQWVAGCGTDAAPYFRIFNPVSQGLKYDPDGSYTRRFVPELQKLPTKFLFCPWEAPAEILDEAGIELGTTYPRPIVDLKLSRQKALDGFKSLS
ncbi:MAG: deoxyribodipyrimidine photo-lyase [Desulfofustis sp.]